VAWLSERFGVGQYELRLQQGARVLCICKADAARAQPAPASQVRLTSDGAASGAVVAGAHRTPTRSSSAEGRRDSD